MTPIQIRQTEAKWAEEKCTFSSCFQLRSSSVTAWGQAHNVTIGLGCLSSDHKHKHLSTVLLKQKEAACWHDAVLKFGGRRRKSEGLHFSSFFVVLTDAVLQEEGFFAQKCWTGAQFAMLGSGRKHNKMKDVRWIARNIHVGCKTVSIKRNLSGTEGTWQWRMFMKL